MPQQTTKIVAIIIFIVTYIGLLVFSKKRAFIALGAAALFVILSITPVKNLLTVINWNLLLMLAGIMGIVWLFTESNMPAVIGDKIISKTSNLRWAIIFLSVFAGIVSAFIDNVATVLIIAPIAINIAKKTETSPVVPIIVISIMSNLQGAATLVGDTTSILLGAEAGLNFFDFFVFHSKPGLFWIIQAAMLMTVVFLMFLLRKNKQKITIEKKESVKSIFPTILLVLTISLLIAVSFLPEKYKFELLNGLICVFLFLIGVVYYAVKAKKIKPVLEAAKGIDYQTLLLIGSLFVIIGGIQNVGLITDISNFFVSITRNPFIIYTLIVFASVILSAFIDNIPYVAAMLPVATGISITLGIEPYLLYFGLLCGATLGGNLTPIGASANITAIGILRKEGHKVSLKNFMKISVPFTLIAVMTGYLLIWFIWS